MSRITIVPSMITGVFAEELAKKYYELWSESKVFKPVDRKLNLSRASARKLRALMMTWGYELSPRPVPKVHHYQKMKRAILQEKREQDGCAREPWRNLDNVRADLNGRQYEDYKFAPDGPKYVRARSDHHLSATGISAIYE